MECGECTLCCFVLPVPWMDSPAGEWCKHCNIGVGCKIFDQKETEECRKFYCAYIQVDGLPIELRPDKCNIVFEKVDDNIFLGTMHPDHNDAYQSEVMQKQLLSFYNKGFSVVIHSFTIDKMIVYPSKGKTIDEVMDSYKEQVRRKYGKPNI